MNSKIYNLKVGSIVKCTKCGCDIVIDSNRLSRYKYKDSMPQKCYCNRECRGNAIRFLNGNCSMCMIPMEMESYQIRAANEGKPIFCSYMCREDFRKYMFNPTIPFNDLAIFSKHLRESALCKKCGVTRANLYAHFKYYGLKNPYILNIELADCNHVEIIGLWKQLQEVNRKHFNKYHLKSFGICKKCGETFKLSRAQSYNYAKGQNVYCRNCFAGNLLKAKFSEELGHIVRSSWEEIAGKWFKNLNIFYQYEPKGFKTPYGRYHPDFYLVDKHRFVEVKGYFTKKSLAKFGYFWKTQKATLLLLSHEIEMMKMDLEEKSCRLTFKELELFSKKNIANLDFPLDIL